MKKIRSSKKGFTLAELLIVVAIIGVLVGISIPIFSAQLRKSKIATNQANARAAYAAVAAGILDKKFAGGTATYSVDSGSLTADVTEYKEDIATSSTAISKWDDSTTGIVSGKLGDNVYSNWTVTIDADGNYTITGA